MTQTPPDGEAIIKSIIDGPDMPHLLSRNEAQAIAAHVATLTAEQTDALAKLDAGTHMLVTQQALDWLNGAGPDENGYWFNHHQELAEIEAIAESRKLPAFWWRPIFRAMITAAQEG